VSGRTDNSGRRGFSVVMTVTEGSAVASSQPSLSIRNQHPFTAIASAVIVILSIVCGLATYLILTGLAPIKPNRELIGALMAANLLLVSLMAGVSCRGDSSERARAAG